MTQISSSVPQYAPNLTIGAWKDRIHLTADGYRVVLFSDGTHLMLSTSQTGESVWSTPGAVTTAIPVTSMSALVDVVLAGNTFYAFIASGGTITCITIPYTGNGTFLAATFTAVVLVPTGTILSIRCLYDSLAGINDSQHLGPSYTGAIMLLVDVGTTWTIYVLDVNTTAPAGIKNVMSASKTIAMSGPTGMTNMIMPVAGSYYALSPGSSAWTGSMWSYVGTTSGAGSVIGNSFSLATLYTGSEWFGRALSFGGQLTGGPFQPRNSAPYGDNQRVPVQDTSSAGGWGFFTPAYAAAVSIATGPWSLSMPFTVNAGTNATFTGTCRVYAYTTATNTYQLLTTLSANTVGLNYLSNPSGNLVFSGTLIAQAFSQGIKLYLEPDITITSMTLSSPYTTAGLNYGTSTFTVPASTSLGSTTYALTAGATETPPINVANTGAALCISDTSTSPGIDLYVQRTSSAISSCTRTVSGGYTNPLDCGTGVQGLQSLGIAAAIDATTGDKVLLSIAQFSAVNHIGFMERTNGLWGSWAQLDTMPDVGMVQRMIGPSSRAFGQMGPATVFTAGATAPYTLNYQDYNYVGLAALSQPPSGVRPIGPQAFGSSSPYSVTTFTPTLEAIFNWGGDNDSLGARRWQVTHGGGPTTDWDSGFVAPGTRIVSGVPFDTIYGSVGTTPVNATLTPGTFYTATCTDRDSISGVSSSSTSCTFYVYTAPSLVVNGPNDITDVTTTLSVTPTQAEGMTCTGLTFSFLDAVTGATLYTVPTYSTSITSGSTWSQSVDLTPAFRSKALSNNRAYTLSCVATFPPPSGPNIQATGLLATNTDLPSPSIPTDLVVYPVVPSDPTETPHLAARWNQANPGGATPNTATWNVYAKDTTAGGDWVLQGSLPASTGMGTASLYSIAHRRQYMVAVTAVTAINVESEFVIYTPDPLVFRLGLAFDDPLSPGTGIELGRIPISSSGGSGSGSAFEVAYAKDMDVDETACFNRDADVVTVGTKYAKMISQAVTVAFELGHVYACKTQMKAWEQGGTRLQVRDMFGNMFPCRIWFTEGARTRADYESIDLQFKQVAKGLVTTILTS